jgi:hypothetical protein
LLNVQKTDGKFILFDVTGFEQWLMESSFTRVIKLLQVHHTYKPSYADFERVKDHVALLRGMERSHMIERGFSEIAQNITTFPDGLVAVCRPIDSIPAGIKGANQYGICLEHVGNFDAGQDVMAPEHRDCIVKVYAHLCRRFNLMPDVSTLQYHHWWDLNTGQRTNGSGNTKSCPGTGFFLGNSLESAQANFIPAVAEELAKISKVRVNVPQTLYSVAVGVDTLNVRNLPSTVIYVAEVDADSLNVRCQPSSQAYVLRQLQRGTRVYAYEERNDWVRIHPVNSEWVNRNFLARTQAVAAGVI